MPTSRKHFRGKILIGFSLFILLYIFSSMFDGREHLFAFFAKYEQYNADELFIALIVTGFVGLFYSLIQIKKMSKEIARRIEAEKNLLWISNHDPLTELPNRKQLENFISNCESQNDQTNYAVFRIVINRYKDINDLLGSDYRTEILRLIAKRLLYMFPDNVFKLAGDELLVLKPNIDNTDLALLAERVIRKICSPIHINAITFNIGTNIGFARFPEDGLDLRRVIQHSDYALSFAKKSGRDQAKAYNSLMQAEFLAKAQREHDFKKALANKEFVTYYQPLVDLKTERTIGFEALARWEIAPGHFIPPDQFVALAEETGNITELTEQLLRLACRDALEWPSHITLSFNISPIQMSDKQLATRIMSILAEVGFPAERLEIEITETALLRDINVARLTLRKLKDEGINIALDDFGTGYSSLSQLCNFPFDKLKIDKSFIDTFQLNGKQEKAILAILSLASALDVKVVAEGIEHVSQLIRLQELGCDIGQGYLLGRPMPQANLKKTVPWAIQDIFNLNPEKAQ